MERELRLLDDPIKSQNCFIRSMCNHSTYNEDSMKKYFLSEKESLNRKNKEYEEQRKAGEMTEKAYQDWYSVYNYDLYRLDYEEFLSDYGIRKNKLYVNRMRKCNNILNKLVKEQDKIDYGHEKVDEMAKISKKANEEIRKMIIQEIIEIINFEIALRKKKLIKDNWIRISGVTLSKFSFSNDEREQIKYEIFELEEALSIYTNERKTTTVLEQFDINSIPFEKLTLYSAEKIYTYLQLQLQYKNENMSVINNVSKR